MATPSKFTCTHELQLLRGDIPADKAVLQKHLDELRDKGSDGEENEQKIFHRGRRVASHMRDETEYRHTTLREHMPEAHQRVAGGADDILAWASTVGPMARAMVERLLEATPIREQGWRSAAGLKRVLRKHGLDRAEGRAT